MVFGTFILFLVTLHGLSTLLNAVNFGGYRRHLEERINTLVVGPDVLRWESQVQENIHKNFPQMVLWILVGFFSIGLVVFLWVTIPECEEWRLWIYGPIWVVEIITMVISLFLIKKGHDESYGRFRKAFEKQSNSEN